MNERAVINVVYITDADFMLPTMVSIRSLIDNNLLSKLNIYIVLFNINDDQIKIISELSKGKKNVDIRLIFDTDSLPIYEIGESVRKNIYVSKTALIKFYLPELLKCLDKVLYLDGDTIINDDIAELNKLDLTDYYVAAVDDMGDVVTAGKSRYADFIGVDRPYFNSGVMLLNLKKMRQDNITAKLISYRKTGRNLFMDQDSFNYVLGNKRYSLPFLYNFLTFPASEMTLDDISAKVGCSGFESHASLYSQQKIMHFASPYKPWKYDLFYTTRVFLKYYKELGEFAGKLEPAPIETELFTRIKTLQKSFDEYREKTEQLKTWKFPYDDVPPASRVIIYGAGKVGQSFVFQIDKCKYVEIVGWVDKNAKNIEIPGKRIDTPDIIHESDYDFIIIAQADKEVADSIMDNLMGEGILGSKIVSLFKDKNGRAEIE